MAPSLTSRPDPWVKGGMKTWRLTRKTLGGHEGGARARVAVDRPCHRGDHFGLECCLLDLPQPGNELFLYARADCGGLCHPLDSLGNKVSEKKTDT